MKIICYFSSAGGYVFQACTSNTYSLKIMIIFALDVSQKSSLVIDTVLHVYHFKAFPKTRLRSFLHLLRSLFIYADRSLFTCFSFKSLYLQT